MSTTRPGNRPHRPDRDGSHRAATDALSGGGASGGGASGGVEVRKRDGRVVPFEPSLVRNAIAAAFRAEFGGRSGEPLDEETESEVRCLTDAVAQDVGFEAKLRKAEAIDVERVQDLVEYQLMHAGHYSVARRYIVYREERNRARAIRGEQAANQSLKVTLDDGSTAPLDAHAIKRRVFEACRGLGPCEPEALLDEVFATLYDGITPTELDKAMIMVARQRIEREPAYSKVAVRLLLNIIYKDALGGTPQELVHRPAPLFESGDDEAEAEAGEESPYRIFEQTYRDKFRTCLEDGIRAELYDARLLDYDLPKLTAAMRPERDQDFQYLGAQTVYDRYLIHVEGRRIETPQFFFMRVAMGLALNETDASGGREDRAIEFYGLLSTFRFVSATPTLFNAGTLHPQLSSCYLTTVDDDLTHIFKSISDNAALSKWAGGLGNDWTSIRATGSHIKGTNGESQGVIPFLKIVNDTALAVNQGGKRKGAVCSYLETWHLDIEEFLELRKNTGDDRRRTHDMHTANWIPDLFMQRVRSGGHWTLFSPNEVRDLHDLYGKAFAERYEHYERLAEAGELRQSKRVEAVTLWRKMLSMVFETGHPWITFKDPSNVRSPQDHAGVVHNSNLCTEILLNTSKDETAVCNLGSINLKAHTTPDGLDEDLLADTIKTAVRMLDNVIDINYYPTPEARTANLRHRPVGLGIMGFQDALFIQRVPYASDAALEFADRSQELISFHAISASAALAAERGAYSTFKGSKWDRGLLPIDTVALLEQERGGDVTIDRSVTLDWQPVRDAIAEHGMRNSNVMAIAPTATISNIAGCTQSIEPTYRNLFVKSNLSGDFTIVNEFLVNDLKAAGLWDEEMLDDLKYFDGSLDEIERVPDELKALYRTAFEIPAEYLIEATSRRQKWIDMGISLNLYIAQPSGKRLNDMYFFAWERGLKTTYYLRATAATQIEKSSVDVNKRGLQPRWMKSKSASSNIAVTRDQPATGSGDAAATEPRAAARPAPSAEPASAGGSATNGADQPESKDLDAVIVAATPAPIPSACSIDSPDCEACQ